MWNTPTKDELNKLPALYSTENIPIPDKIIQMHFFIGSSDWFVVEYDQKSQMFWGFAILNQDYFNSEWGYFSLEELSEIRVNFLEIDRNLYFTQAKAKEIEKIRVARNW